MFARRPGDIKAMAGRFRLLAAPLAIACSVLGLAGVHVEPASANEAGAVSTVSSALPAASSPMALPRRANFFDQAASRETRQVADWAVSSGDNGGLPFLIIDKVAAKVFAFDGTGQLQGASMALLGLARGDDSPPGIGSRKLITIRPEERITPAGRFVARLGHDFKQDILWIDYDNALALHPVVTGSPGDHRRERLATTSTLDKRISFGCVNVPPNFFYDIVFRAFTGTNGIVYILPEVHKLEEVFPQSASAAVWGP